MVVFGILVIVFGLFFGASIDDRGFAMLFYVCGSAICIIPLIKKEQERKNKRAWETAGSEQSRRDAERDRLRAEARARGQASCPFCGSTSLAANKKGYGVTKGALGAWAFGPLGAAAGNIGRQKVIVTCINCGRQFNPSVQHFVDENFRQKSPPRSDRYDPPIPTGFAEYLRETGQEDPRYSGRNNALECVLIDMADDKERAVMWAYAVDCARRGRTMGNILHAPDYHKYRAFGEYASRHGDMLASIAARRAWEYWEPTKTTKAYKAAAEFLS